MKTVLYAASTASHILRFHLPYVRGLTERGARVITAGAGDGVDLSIPFEKKMFSIRNFRLLSRIRAVVRENGVDAVITNTALASFFIRFALRPMKKRPRVICIAHGYLFDAGGGLKNRLLRTAERAVRNTTDTLLVMNREDAALAARYRLARTDALLIRGMGFGSRPLPPMDKAEARALLGLEDGQRVVLYVGELSKRKNQALLIRAAARLRREGCPLTLCLLGSGGEEERLRALADELEADVRFAGNIEDPRLLSAYFSAADLYASASEIEGLPFNLMEAMEAGLPIVASDSKGQTDLLEGSSALLFPRGDLEALTEQLRRALRESPSRATYPRLSDYRIEAVYEENLAILSDACGIRTEDTP